MTNLSRHLVSRDRAGRHLYRFPNGQEVSVIPDPGTPLRWELLAYGGSGNPEVNLTSEQAEKRLAEIAAEPMPEWDGKS
ncbi:hypothetical protein [Dactylosporangium sp. CA-139066]|uniref:hypothetical protein n=1 Tax=Dactylosporangium sp. CA-139066 TaxID=3239930 RepID=UPI003D941908